MSRSEEVTDYVQKTKSLCAIIQERDAEILKKRLMIKAKENETIENKRKIELKRHEIDGYKEEIKAMEEVCNKQKFIKSWLIENREVQVQVLLNQNKLKSFVSEEVRIKTEKSVELQAEFAAKAAEAKAMCLKSLEYQEMEKNRITVLKVDVALKIKQADIRNAKKRIALKKEIDRKLFYAFFIKLAEDYLAVQKWREYQQLQQNIQALTKEVNNLRDKENELAKTVAFKRKLEIYNFGNQFTPREKPASFSREEFKENAAKIQIFENKTIRPPLQPPKPEPPLFNSMPQKQLINRKSLLLRKWQKIVAKKSDKLNNSQSSQLSQQKNLNVSKEGDKSFQVAYEPEEELIDYEPVTPDNQTPYSQPVSKISVYGPSKNSHQSILQSFTKNNENCKVSQTIKSTTSNIVSDEGSQKKKYSGETPKTVRFTMDQPFGQSMFMDMTKGYDKSATFTLPESPENMSFSRGEITTGRSSDMNVELSGYESGVTNVPEFSFAAPEFQQSSTSIAPVPFSSATGFFSLQNQMPFRF